MHVSRGSLIAARLITRALALSDVAARATSTSQALWLSDREMLLFNVICFVAWLPAAKAWHARAVELPPHGLPSLC